MLKIGVAVEVEVNARCAVREVKAVACNVNEDRAAAVELIAVVLIDVNTLASSGGRVVFPTWGMT